LINPNRGTDFPHGGAVVMAVGGIAEIFFGVNAEGETLESIAEPLSAAKRRVKSGTEVGSGQEPPAAIV